MKTNPQTSSMAKAQSDKFKAMAKELGADSDEKSFDKTLKAISKPKGKPANSK